ncbi:MAG: hypothetical protein ACYC63_04765 [Armatimonadota bacterium]
MAVKDFIQQRNVKREVVAFNGKRLALPSTWTKAKWNALSKKQRGYIFMACTSFKFYLQHVYLPFKSQIEGEDCPKKLPSFMADFASTFQSRVPEELLPFDHKRISKTWRVCMVWPTGCFKSSLIEAAESWLMGLNPNISIMKGVSVQNLGERFVSFHKDNLDNNEAFRYVFGDLNPKSSRPSRVWRTDAIEVDRPMPRSTPTYQVVGYGGSFEGTRFDVGFIDDIVDFQNSKTEQARTDQDLWVSQVFERRLHPRRRLLLVIGTVHHRTDVYHRYAARAKSEGTWDFTGMTMIPQTAIDAGIWPPKKKNPNLPYSMDNVIIPLNLPVLWDFWTPEVLVSEFIDSPHTFARTRQNQIHDPDLGMFTAQELDYCLANGGLDPDGRRKPDLVFWNHEDGIPQPGSKVFEMYLKAGIKIEYAVVTCDLAATDKRPGVDPDWTVFQLWGWCSSTKRRVLLAMIRFRTSKPKILKKKLADFVRGFLPIVRKVAAEANAVDKLFVGELDDYLKEELGVHVAVMGLRGEKAELIESFKDLISDPGVWIPYSVASGRTRTLVNVFREELLDYPSGKHDDTLITAVHHIRLLKAGTGNTSQGSAHVLRDGEEEGAIPDADLGAGPDDAAKWEHLHAEIARSKSKKGAGSSWRTNQAQLSIGSFR